MNIAKTLCLAVCLAIILSSCAKEKDQAIKPAADRENIIKVSVATVAGKGVQRSVEITGTLAPWDEVMVGNEMPGVIEKMFADLGDRVSRGDLLAMLNQLDARANLEASDAAYETNVRSLERAKAVWNDADTELKRYTKLFNEGVVSQAKKDSVQSQYDIAEAQLRQAEAQVSQANAQRDLAKKRLADTEIKSPISGEIKKRFVSAGEVLRDKTPLFAVVLNDPLKFQGSVPEASVPFIKMDQDVEVNIDAYPDKKFSGKVIRMSPSIDSQTRTLAVEVRVPNTGNVLKSGFFARAIIMTKKDVNIPFAPEESIYSLAGINKAYVISNDAASERQLKLGVNKDGVVEIVEGLMPGEVVAISGIDQLFDGAKVEVVK